MRNLYRKHLEIKYKHQVTLENITELKNLFQLEFMQRLEHTNQRSEYEEIEMEVLGRTLSHNERRVELFILGSPTAVLNFCKVTIDDLDKNFSDTNRFFRLNEKEQKTCLEYLYELKINDMKRARLFVIPLQKMGMRIETIPQKYFDMTNEELKAEIDNWRWPTT